MLEVQNLYKQLGDNVVLNGVGFRINEGEFFVMLGPSGSGKSTLLRVICGLEQPDAGEVLIDGQPITGLPPRNRNLAMVFQDYGLYPNMNVYQNIAYGLQARRVPEQEIAQRVPDAAQKLGVAELLERSIVDLSGGEQQRVALARALVKDADAYLFDEPLSNLDPKLRHRARRDILFLHREKRRPSLYVTHDQTEALAVADRIGLLMHGVLQQVATPDAMLQQPANLAVAAFVGEPPMNLVDGEVQGENGALFFVADGLRLRLPDRWRDVLDAQNQRAVVLGFRPETLVRADEDADFEVSDDNTFDAEVVDTDALIGETIAHLRVGAANHLNATFEESLFALDDAEAVEAGQRLRVALDMARITLFDPQSERALT